VWRVLREQLLYPYHLQRVQALTASDYPARLQFCQWLLQRCIVQPPFLSSILFTDEAGFCRDGIINFHNNQLWANVNPHGTMHSGHQQRFTINVWAGLIGNVLVGPHVLPRRLTGPRYRNFLENDLAQLLEEVPLTIRQRMWFLHDGAPAHFSLTAREHLNNIFPHRWIGRGGPVAWPLHSPDLNPLDFYLWGHLKTLVYSNPTPDVDSLRQRVEQGCASIRRIDGLCERIRQSLMRRAQLV
jgi:hypothetical protein